jgi:hypothetical protein
MKGSGKETRMRDRTLPFAGSFTVAAALATAASLCSGSLAAQGHPNLSGTYNVETITPLERPAGVDKLVLSDVEAAALEAYEAQRNVEELEPLDPNRPAPPAGGEQTRPKSYLEFLERAGGGIVGGYNRFWLSEGTKVITVNGEKRSSIVVDPPNGHIPQMKPEARLRNAAFLRARVDPSAAENGRAGPPGAYDGPEARPLSERCLLGFGSTSGPPTLPNYFYNNLKQIVQTDDYVMILNEMIHDARIIRMNAGHLPPSIRRWMGDSVGRWEGDTLVVDTTNFTDKTQFQGSRENLHVVERFTRLDDGNLLYRFTVEDRTTWDTPWTGEYPWVASTEQIYEYACHEGNYALQGVLRGARVTEADAAAKEGSSGR